MSSSFDADLAEQEIFEMQVAKYLARQKKALIWPNAEGINSDQDFKLFVPQGIEVKHDKKAQQTGNLFFEIFNPRQNCPSGIAVTKAALVYHFVPPSRLFSYEPNYVLSALTKLKEQGDAIMVNVRDGNSRGYVVKIEVMLATGYLEEEQFQP